jgi:hypothetical protein
MPVNHDEKFVPSITQESSALFPVLAPVGMYEDAPEPASTWNP